MLGRAEKVALSDTDIQRMIKAPIKIFEYDNLPSMTLEQVMETGIAVILLQIKGGHTPIGHWIALLKYDDHIEHFDPYGLTLDQELALTHEEPYLSQMLQGVTVKNANVQLQNFKEDVNTCGRHVAVRCNYKKMSYEDYVRFLRSLDGDPDEAVTLMTMLL